jgi:hypothetical protein
VVRRQVPHFQVQILHFPNVLEEAEDDSNPLLERVKFLAILGSNMDEFFMVRAARLAAQMDAGSLEAGPDGLSPRAQLVAISSANSHGHLCWPPRLRHLTGTDADRGRRRIEQSQPRILREIREETLLGS